MKYIHVLKNKNFRLLWLGQVCSGFGNWIYSIALLIFIANLNFSGVFISSILIVRMIPFILIGPLVGNYIDGKSKKKIMIYSDVIRMLLVILMVGLVYAYKKNLFETNFVLVMVYINVLVSTFVGTFFNPAQGAIMPIIVKKDELKAVNSFMSMSNSFTLILGPAFAGMLVALLGLLGVFWLNVATFLISAICIWVIKVEENPEKMVTNAEGLVEKYTKGWKIIITDKIIYYYVLTSAARSLVVGIINISFLFVAENVFSNGRESVGWLYFALGLGLMVGSLVYGAFKEKSNEKYIYLGAILANAIFSIFYVNLSVWYLVLFMLFIVGFSDGFQMVIFDTSIQKRFAPENLAKIFSSAYALIMTVQLLSMGLGGWFIDIWGYKIIVIYTSIIIILISFIALLISNGVTGKKVEGVV